MFGFFKKDKKANTAPHNKDFTKAYWDSLYPVIWDDYCCIDKYKKVSAFTLEDINCIPIINYCLEQKQNNPYAKLSFTNEVKILIKEEGLTLKDISLKVSRYTHICSLINHYSKMLSLTLSTHWLLVDTFDKTYRFAKHRDDPVWDTMYPPNSYHCTHKVRAYRETELKRRENDSYISVSDIKVENDFDFNIPEYFINNIAK